MDARPDIVVHSPDGRVQLVVEVKAKRQASREWAAKMRRNLVAHQMIPPANYFMLALPDEIHLWRDTVTPQAIPPDMTIATDEALGHYAARFAVAGLSEHSLELVLYSWLSDLAHFGSEEERNKRGWLSETGLADAIRNGRVETAAAA